MLPALGTYFCCFGLSQTLHFSNPAVNLLRALYWQKAHPTKWTNKNLIRFLPDFLPPLLQLSAGAVAASQGTRRATHQSLFSHILIALSIRSAWLKCQTTSWPDRHSTESVIALMRGWISIALTNIEWCSWARLPTEKLLLQDFQLQRWLKLADEFCTLSRRKKQDPSIRKRFRTEKTLIQDNRCYGKATLEGCQIWNFYNFIGAPVDIWEKQEKTQMWRISSHMCDPRVTWAPPGQRKTGWESQLGS